MQVDHFFDDRQPQAVAALGPVPGAVRFIKSLENMRQVLLGNADPAVLDRDDNLVDLLPEQNGDASPLGSKLQTVAKQVGPYLIEPVAIAFDHDSRQVKIDVDGLGRPLRLKTDDDLPDLLVQPEGFRMKRMVFGLQ
ncbi:hypothetical protein D1872_253010 [compost metagenome]